MDGPLVIYYIYLWVFIPEDVTRGTAPPRGEYSVCMGTTLLLQAYLNDCDGV
jgi:hypothetical protein